jgi:hypothetical protein
MIESEIRVRAQAQNEIAQPHGVALRIRRKTKWLNGVTLRIRRKTKWLNGVALRT